MANKYTTQTLSDTNQHTVIKLTGLFDGSTTETSNTRIQANTLNFALDTSKANLLSSIENTGALSYYGLSIDRIWYNSSASVELYWSSTANANTIMYIPSFGTGSYNGEGNWVTIPNNAEGQVGCVGDIGIKSVGTPAVNTSYDIIISLRKDNNHYSRGQLADPSAFNYGEYALKP
jgi:hypothetical protein